MILVMEILTPCENMDFVVDFATIKNIRGFLRTSRIKSPDDLKSVYAERGLFRELLEQEVLSKEEIDIFVWHVQGSFTDYLKDIESQIEIRPLIRFTMCKDDEIEKDYKTHLPRKDVFYLHLKTEDLVIKSGSSEYILKGRSSWIKQQ